SPRVARTRTSSSSPTSFSGAPSAPASRRRRPKSQTWLHRVMTHASRNSHRENQKGRRIAFRDALATEACPGRKRRSRSRTYSVAEAHLPLKLGGYEKSRLAYRPDRPNIAWPSSRTPRDGIHQKRVRLAAGGFGYFLSVS